MMGNVLFFNGGPGAIRTPDLLIRSKNTCPEYRRFQGITTHFTQRKNNRLERKLLKSVEALMTCGFGDRLTNIHKQYGNPSFPRLRVPEITELLRSNGRTAPHHNRTIGG